MRGGGERGDWDHLSGTGEGGSFAVPELHPGAYSLYLKFIAIALVHTVMVMPRPFV